MAKANPLSKALDNKGKKTSKAKAATANGNGNEIQASRVGRVMIGGHFLPEVQRQLRIIAATEDTTLQALYAEAINMLFARRGLPEIATLAPDSRKGGAA